MHHDRLACLLKSAPQVVASAEAYRTLAVSWGIKAPPVVNFRTHILVVTAAPQRLRPVRYELSPGGDLKASATNYFYKCDMPADRLNYQLKSFPRRGLRSVNGSPIPAK